MRIETTRTVRVFRTAACIAILGLIALVGTQADHPAEQARVQGMPAPAADAVAEPQPQTF